MVCDLRLATTPSVATSRLYQVAADGSAGPLDCADPRDNIYGLAKVWGTIADNRGK